MALHTNSIWRLKHKERERRDSGGIKIKKGKSGKHLFSQITGLRSAGMATENSPDLQTAAFRNMVTKNGTPDQQTVAFSDTEAGLTESRVAERTSGSFVPSLRFIKKVVAEFIGTFFLIFVGCGAVVVDKKTNGSITHLGVSLVWGMAVMILIYAIGHISGAHFNPAVTLAFAAVRRFPCVHIPAYIGAQVVASICSAFVLRLMFGEVADMGATVPTGSNMQSFFFEIFVTFLLMFVISAVATDTRAIGELAGLAVGATIGMNVAISGPISGASMNPARTIGSAVAGNKYTSIWIYMVAPVLGAILGAISYNMIRLTDKPVREITKSGSFLKCPCSTSSVR